ncbi:rod shape-determining protein MreD [Jatrophihabitans sp. GAS493]|uniref:rod shape-determining protein MreD n=1 Tax=Jatrophihabitans sp. GAS493 TaxID=1907575 RepID=UPI000BB877AB|nr:rod shape-determining protein MreD [Jatrophihabitans sp. GAS493]SOD72978.1 rod shape-determining protein MreD [Jatrophihabitans sp. GAS493]
MTIQRLAAAAAAILTALLLQATVIGPISPWVPISLPAVLVAAIGLRCGAGAGISVGFSAGLLADLGSAHPVGVLALTWMGLGIVCAAVAEMLRGRRAQILFVALAAALASSLAAGVLVIIGTTGAALTSILTGFLPLLVGDLLLAAIVTPLVNRAASAESLRRVGAASGQPAAGASRASTPRYSPGWPG